MAKLLIDIDGVVTKYSLRRLVREHFNVDFKGAVDSYGLSNALGVGESEIREMFRKAVLDRPIFIKNSLDTLRELNKSHEITIYTRKMQFCNAKELAQWLIDYKIPFNGISETGKERTYDFHVDDCPSKLADSNSVIKILFLQEWNKKCHDIKGQFWRVKNWEQVKRLVG